MPQTLKKELRYEILAAASIEFYKDGYEKTSVRAIANRAGMTVGNIYRYFENKRDIFDSIIMPIIELFDKMLLKYTDNTISIHDLPDKPVEDFAQYKSVIKVSIDNMALELADILLSNKQSALVLTVTDRLFEYTFSEWYKRLILNYIPYTLGDNRKMDKSMDTVYECYAHSALSGIMFIIEKAPEFHDKNEFSKLIKEYVYLILRIDE